MDAVKMIRAALDAVFPAYCVGCGDEGKIICANCRSAICRAPLFICSGCGRASPGGVTHFACKEDSPLDALLAPYPYADPLVRNLIKNFKYRGGSDAKKIIADLAATSARQLDQFFPKSAIVVALPLHARRERERGFNQAETIGRAVSEALELKYISDLVSRDKPTEEQARLPFHERAENCLNVFSSKPVSGSVILVDDVVTTGATLKASAAALKTAGALRVIGFALAHG